MDTKLCVTECSVNKHKDKESLYINKLDFFEIVLIGILILIKSSGMEVASVILLIIISIGIFIRKIDYTFYYILLLIPNINTVAINNFPIVNLIIVVSLLKLLVSIPVIKIKSKLFLLSFSLIFFEMLHFLMYDINEIISLAFWSITIIYITLYFNYSQEKYSHVKSTFYLSSGVLISILSGLKHINILPRFLGGAGDPNYLSLYILLSITGLISILPILKRQTNRLVAILLVITFSIFGLMTQSKMFIIIFLIIIILLSINFLKTLSMMKIIKFIVSIYIIGLFTTLIIPKDFLNNLILLFIDTIERLAGVSNLTEFTSSRNIIIDNIFAYMNKNPLSYIFGIGLQGYNNRYARVINVAPFQTHNVYLEMLLTLGLIGTCLLLAYITNLLLTEKNKKRKTNIIKVLPIIVLAFSGLSLSMLIVEIIYILLIYSIKNMYWKVSYND